MAETIGPYILVAASTPEEADGIAKELTELTRTRIGGRTVFSGSIEHSAVRLVVTGPGMVNTAHSLTAVIETRMPKAILMTGCAGGFAQTGLQVGDIGVATEENDAQLGIEAEVDDAPLAPLPFDLGVFYGKGVKHQLALDTQLSSKTLDMLQTELDGMSLMILAAPFITVSAITATDKRALALYEQFGACMENMEGFAAAYISKHYNIPFVEIRSASNLVGKRDRDSWNLPLACERSALAAVTWLKNQ